jgi:hypothetical protein
MAGVTFIPWLPAVAVGGLSIMGIISEAPGLLKGIFWGTFLISLVLFCLPFYVLLFVGKKAKPKSADAAPAAAAATGAAAAAATADSAEVPAADSAELEAADDEVFAADEDAEESLDLDDADAFEDEEK